MPTFGTSYFVSRPAAIRYYSNYGYESADIDRMLADGSIHIGRPPHDPRERLIVIDSATRYAICDDKP